MNDSVTPVSPIRSSDTGVPPNTPPAPLSVGDLARHVGLSRLALDLGQPGMAGLIMADVQGRLRALAAG